MALKTSKVTEYGLEAQNAYARIETVSMPDKNTAVFSVAFYVNTSFPSFTKEQYAFNHDLDGENVFKQAYCYLKTLPEFANATDC